MPRKTDGDKIDELQKTVAILEQRSEHTENAMAELNTNYRGFVQQFNDIRRELEREIAVLKVAIDELRRWTEKNGIGDPKSEISLLKDKVTKLETAMDRIGTRAWSVVPNIVGALVSAFIGAIVAILVTRPR